MPHRATGADLLMGHGGGFGVCWKGRGRVLDLRGEAFVIRQESLLGDSFGALARLPGGRGCWCWRAGKVELIQIPCTALSPGEELIFMRFKA